MGNQFKGEHRVNPYLNAQETLPETPQVTGETTEGERGLTKDAIIGLAGGVESFLKAPGELLRDVGLDPLRDAKRAAVEAQRKAAEQPENLIMQSFAVSLSRDIETIENKAFEPQTGLGKSLDIITNLTLGYALTGGALAAGSKGAQAGAAALRAKNLIRTAKTVEKVAGAATGLGASKTILARAGRGAIADFVFYGAQEDNLFNAIQGTALANPISEFLAAEEDDTAVTLRLKAAVEGAALGVPIDKFLTSLSAMRTARKARKASTTTLANAQTELRSAKLARDLTAESAKRKGLAVEAAQTRKKIRANVNKINQDTTPGLAKLLAVDERETLKAYDNILSATENSLKGKNKEELKIHIEESVDFLQEYLSTSSVRSIDKRQIDVALTSLLTLPEGEVRLIAARALLEGLDTEIPEAIIKLANSSFKLENLVRLRQAAEKATDIAITESSGRNINMDFVVSLFNDSAIQAELKASPEALAEIVGIINNAAVLQDAALGLNRNLGRSERPIGDLTRKVRTKLTKGTRPEELVQEAREKAMRVLRKLTTPKEKRTIGSFTREGVKRTDEQVLDLAVSSLASSFNAASGDGKIVNSLIKNINTLTKDKAADILVQNFYQTTLLRVGGVTRDIVSSTFQSVFRAPEKFIGAVIESGLRKTGLRKGLKAKVLKEASRGVASTVEIGKKVKTTQKLLKEAQNEPKDEIIRLGDEILKKQDTLTSLQKDANALDLLRDKEIQEVNESLKVLGINITDEKELVDRLRNLERVDPREILKAPELQKALKASSQAERETLEKAIQTRKAEADKLLTEASQKDLTVKGRAEAERKAAIIIKKVTLDVLNFTSAVEAVEKSVEAAKEEIRIFAKSIRASLAISGALSDIEIKELKSSFNKAIKTSNNLSSKRKLISDAEVELNNLSRQKNNIKETSKSVSEALESELLRNRAKLADELANLRPALARKVQLEQNFLRSTLKEIQATISSYVSLKYIFTTKKNKLILSAIETFKSSRSATLPERGTEASQFIAKTTGFLSSSTALKTVSLQKLDNTTAGTIIANIFGMHPSELSGEVLQKLGEVSRAGIGMQALVDDLHKAVTIDSILRADASEYIRLGKSAGLFDQLNVEDVIAKQYDGLSLSPNAGMNLSTVDGKAVAEFDEFFKLKPGTVDDYILTEKAELESFIGESARTVGQTAEEVTNTISLSSSRNLDIVGNWIMRMRQEYKPLALIVPYVRTNLNIVKFAIDRTVDPIVGVIMSSAKLKGIDLPVNDSTLKVLGIGQNRFFREVFSENRREAVEAYGRLATSIGTLTSAYFLAENYIAGGDGIVGEGPDNFKEREIWEAAGNTPYSIRIGKTNVQFDQMGPVGTVLGYVADLYNSANFDTTEEQESQTVFSNLLLATTNALRDRTFFRSAHEAMDIFSKGDEDRLIRFGKRLSSSLLPIAGSGVAKELSNVLDGGVATELDADLDGIGDYIAALKQKFSIGRLGLRKRRNFLGEEIKASGYSEKEAGEGAVPVINPFRATSTGKADPVFTELAALGHGFREIERLVTIGGVKIDLTNFINESGQDALDRYRELSGTVVLGGSTLKEHLGKVFATDVWSTLRERTNSHEDKRRADQALEMQISLVQRTLRKFREKAKRQMLDEYPEIMNIVRPASTSIQQFLNR